MENKLTFYVMMVFVVILVTIPVSQSFASSNPQIFDITIQLFFVTSDKDCSKVSLETIKFYAEIITKHFNNYGYQYVSIDHNCATTEQINVLKDDSGPFYKYNSDFDLVIFIPDRIDSLRFLFSEFPDKIKFGHWWNRSDTKPQEIISATVFLDIFNQQAVWTLSHELSHFILYNLKYPESVYGGDDKSIGFYSYVHKTDKIYDDELCVLQTKPTASCKMTYYELKLLNGQIFKVMAIYDKPIPVSIKKLESSKNSYTIDDTITITGEIENYDPRISKQATLLIIDPNGVIFVNEQVEPNYYDGTFSISINPNKSKWSTSGSYKISAKYSIATDTDYFQFKASSSTPYIEPKPVQPQKLSKPILQVFFPDESFMTTEGETLEFEGKLLQIRSDKSIVGIPNAEIIIRDTTPVTISGKNHFYEIGSALTNDYGEFKIIWKAVENPANHEYDYSIWNPIVGFSGNSNFEPVSLILTSFFVDYSSKATILPQDTDNDGILDERDHCILNAENYNGYQDSDGCPDTKPKPNTTISTPITYQTVLTLQIKESDEDGYVEINPALTFQQGKYLQTSNIQISINDKSYIVNSNEWNTIFVGRGTHTIKGVYEGTSGSKGTNYQSSSDSIEITIKKISENEIKKLRSSSFDTIEKLKKDVLNGEKSLKSITVNKDEARKKLVQASVALTNAKSYVDQLNEDFWTGDYYLNENDYYTAERYLYPDTKLINATKYSLNEVSSLIQEAKQLEKTCFLFWCW